MAGLPFIPATTLSPYALLAPDAKAQPDPTQQRQAKIYEWSISANQPGQWAGDRSAQTSHYTDVISIAIKAYLDSIGAAKYTLYEHKIASILKKSASATGHFSRDDNYEPVAPEDHPLARVLEQPGGQDGVWSLGQECTYLALQNLLTGSAPAWCIPNDAGKPVRFYALTSALVQSMVGAGMNPQYPKGAYRVMPYGANFALGMSWSAGAWLPAEQVPLFNEPHPWARNLGMSRLQVGALAIDILEAISMSRWSYFDTGLQLDTLIMLPGASEEAVEGFSKRLTANHGGSRKARTVLAVGGSGMEGTTGAKFDVKQLNPGPREMDYNESYDNAAAVVLALFRVPKGVAGFTSQTSYSQHYAELQQFHDLGISPFARNLSAFLTQALARPWCERAGQFKVECEAPAPKNLEAEEKEREFALQQGVITVNEYRKSTGREPVADGDLPASVSLQKQQQAIAPQPQPGAVDQQGNPVSENSALPQDSQENGAVEEQQADDSPEATQDAVTGAALQALGVPPDDDSADQSDAVEKALAPPTKPSGVASIRRKRAEGAVWTGADGKKWTKRNGKIVAATLDREASDFGKKKIPTARPVGSDPKAAIAAHLGLSVPKQQPTQQRPQASPVDPGANHDRLAAQLLNGRQSLNLLHAGAGGKYAAHTITDGASLKAFLDKGGKLPPAAFQEAAKAVPVATPVAQQTVAGAKQWAAGKADQHADRVAAHFGISRERAHQLLVHAIVAVARHAEQGGGNARATIRDPRTGKTATLAPKKPAPGSTPTGGAVPRPVNAAAKGSRPPKVAKAMSACDDSPITHGVLVAPPAVARRRKKRKPLAELSRAVLKSLDTRG